MFDSTQRRERITQSLATPRALPAPLTDWTEALLESDASFDRLLSSLFVGRADRRARLGLGATLAHALFDVLQAQIASPTSSFDDPYEAHHDESAYHPNFPSAGPVTLAQQLVESFSGGHDSLFQAVSNEVATRLDIDEPDEATLVFVEQNLDPFAEFARAVSRMMATGHHFEWSAVNNQPAESC